LNGKALNEVKQRSEKHINAAGIEPTNILPFTSLCWYFFCITSKTTE